MSYHFDNRQKPEHVHPSKTFFKTSSTVVEVEGVEQVGLITAMLVYLKAFVALLAASNPTEKFVLQQARAGFS